MMRNPYPTFYWFVDDGCLHEGIAASVWLPPEDTRPNVLFYDLNLKWGDISDAGRKTPPAPRIPIDACGCGAAIERGAKMCRYCAMKLAKKSQDAEDVRLARAGLREASEHGTVSWDEVKSRLDLNQTARTA